VLLLVLVLVLITIIVYGIRVGAYRTHRISTVVDDCRLHATRIFFFPDFPLKRIGICCTCPFIFSETERTQDASDLKLRVVNSEENGKKKKC